ncbi:hypothetical protein AO377_0334 [Moraxella catarrhalis]|nr:hypothetical protein AO377_0334 [Moraxella catarrhalis]
MPTVVAMPQACIIAFFGEERFGRLRIHEFQKQPHDHTDDDNI